MSGAADEDVLSTLQLLSAMYPLDGELVLSEAAAAALAAAEAGEEPALAAPLELVVRVSIDDDDDTGRTVELAITLGVAAKGEPVKVMVRQPPFLSRAGYARLTAACVSEANDGDTPNDLVMAAIEAVRSSARTLADEEAAAATSAADGDDSAAPVPPPSPGPPERVWFWFPSLSTKEKRRDLVEYAAAYHLTGFVLAGKPGLLCLEGGGREVDRYMAAIKSESWGDIPSYQKKVSEVCQ